MDKRDLKTLLFGLGITIFLSFISLPDTVDTFGRTYNVDTFTASEKIKETEIYYFRELELNAWRAIKGVGQDEYQPFGLDAYYPDIYSLKLDSRGLAIDEEGNVVPEEYIGKIRAPFTYLIIGSSSVLEGVGPQLERDLYTIPEMTVVREGRYSTGLNRKDYFNWYPYAQRLIQVHKPNAVIVEVGGNDGQAIRDENNRLVPLSSSRWDEVYEDRVREFMNIVTDGTQKVYWTELTIPKTREFYNKFKRINEITERVASEYENVIYVKTWDRFAIDGRYSNSVQNDDGRWGIAKYSDGIHLTPFGSKIYSGLIMNEIKKDIIIEENN